MARSNFISYKPKNNNYKLEKMKDFMDENFLLQTETAQKLYHEHAKKMPIIDYHCHLIPRMVAHSLCRTPRRP